MKKGGKQPSKRNKQRKMIKIKQSLQLSPLKQLSEYQTQHYEPKNDSKRFYIPSLPKLQLKLTTSQIESFNGHADSLQSIQLMRAIVNKELLEMNKFLQQVPLLHKTILKAVSNLQKSFSTIKQERIDMMKQDTVVFVPPDKDIFEKQKGKILNKWIFQQKKIHQRRQKNGNLPEQWHQIFRETESKIKNKSIEVPSNKIQPFFQKKTLQIEQRNRQIIQRKLKEVKSNLSLILDSSNEMRIIKQMKEQQRSEQQLSKQVERRMGVAMKVGSKTSLLFQVSDYFF